jgi:two-component system response regulator YesN
LQADRSGMKYKVLVADDEYIIRRGIIKLLSKYSDLEVVAEAEDGEQAFEQAKDKEIDIFFVDINMPFMNGLQFIEKIKELQPNTIVNVITGYDKFEYVRQALRLGVFEYILKPLNENAFHETIDKILNAMKQKNEEEKYLRWAKAILGINKSNYISEFLDRSTLLQYSEEKVREEIDFLGLDLPEKYTMTLIYYERIENPDIRKHWNDKLLYASVENIAKESYESLAPLYLCKNNKGYLILICRTESKDMLDFINQEFKSVVERYLPAKVILAQQSDNNCYHIPKLYQDLLEKLEDIKCYPSIVKKTKQYIEESYYREELSLNDVAEYVNLSPQHLSRIFKKEMDITFIDYLTNVRIGKAIELFSNDALKMYEIAEKIGYSSQHYFSSVFKKVIGVSPIEYRNQRKELQRENFYGLS